MNLNNIVIAQLDPMTIVYAIVAAVIFCGILIFIYLESKKEVQPRKRRYGRK